MKLFISSISEVATHEIMGVPLILPTWGMVIAGFRWELMLTLGKTCVMLSAPEGGGLWIRPPWGMRAAVGGDEWGKPMKLFISSISEVATHEIMGVPLILSFPFARKT